MTRKLGACIGLAGILMVLFLLMPGCTYQRRISTSPPGFPEEVFTYPCMPQSGSRYRVAVMRFMEPAHMPGMGKQASQYLYQELLSRGTFSSLNLDLYTEDLSRDHLLYMARQNRYNLIITGEIQHAIDGGISSPSQVNQAMTVWGLFGQDLNLCCSARAVDLVAPAASVDLIVVQGEGAPAPSMAWLMQRNAQKFANLLNHSFHRPSGPQ